MEQAGHNGLAHAPNYSTAGLTDAGSCHEDTTNPSEHERQVAEVTSSECVKPCVVGSEVMPVSVASLIDDLGSGNSTDHRPVGESGLRSLEG